MTQLHEQYTLLDAAIKDEQYTEVITIANKILQQQSSSSSPPPGASGNEVPEEDAFKCKVIASVHLGFFSEILAELEGHPNRDAYRLQISYALYREKKFEEALKVLEGMDEEPRVWELQAQIYYALEQYAEAEKLYEHLIANSGATSDLLTNLSATYVKSGNFTQLVALLSEHGGGKGGKTTSTSEVTNSFEFLYNVGTAFLERGDTSKAVEYLNRAKDTCTRQLQSDGVPQEDIDNESAIILAQLAYLQQRKGAAEEAKKMYEEVLAKKPTDSTVEAVCKNNIISLRHGTDKFDSLRKLQQLSKDETLTLKLTASQRQIIGFNHCLVLLLMKKTEECVSMLGKLQEKFPNTDLFLLLHATILFKEDKHAEAQEKLSAFITAHPDADTLHTSLVMAQLHLSNGNVLAAIQVLAGIEKLQNAPAMICTLVTLYQKVNDPAGAIRVLDKAVRSISDGESYYPVMLRSNADFKFACGRWEEAAKVYKQLLKHNRNDKEVMTNLIISLAQYDTDAAQELAERLPELEGEPVDANELENLPVSITSISIKRKQDKKDIEDKTKEKQKDKKKKKKKNKQPKEIVPGSVPDPDRWKPKHERASFRGRRRGGARGGTRGAQGVVPSAPVTDSTTTTTTTTTTKTQTQVQPSQKQKEQSAPAPAGRGGRGGRGRGRRGK